MSFWKSWMPTGITASVSSSSGSNGVSGSLMMMNSPSTSSETMLKQASAQTKADIQEIINKHQAAALLEANQNIRDLQQEREDHLEKLKVQRSIIEHLNKEASSGTQNGTEEVQDLKKQLREKDALIAKLKQQQHDSTTPTQQDNNIQELHQTISTLTQKVSEQQEEIDRLQSVLREIEAFHLAENHDSQDVPETELESIEEEDPLNNASVDTSLQEDSDSGGSEEDQQQDEQGQLPNKFTASVKIPPPQQMTLNGNQLVLLISSMPANNTVKANQKRLEIILQGLHLSPEEVQVLDGCDPTSINLRNDLFAISGKHAKYPQLFLVNFQQNDIGFVGDYDAIMDLHDSQRLETTVGLTPI